MLPYLQLFLLAMFCALLIAPIVTRLAQKFGIVDAPGVRKVHTKTVACLVRGVDIYFDHLPLTDHGLYTERSWWCVTSRSACGSGDCRFFVLLLPKLSDS